MFNFRPIPLGSIPEIEPVFVVGAARSGTTPLQLALNMHPELGVYGETQAFFVHRKFAAERTEMRLRRLLAYWRVVLSGVVRTTIFSITNIYSADWFLRRATPTY